MTGRFTILRLMILGVCSTTPLLHAAEDDSTTPPGVIATVNGEDVPLAAVERSLARTHSTQSAGRPAEADLDRLLFRVVNDVLIAQEARALGLDQEPPIPESVADFRRERAVNQLERAEIWSQAIPTQEEIQKTYEDKYRRVTFRVMTAYEREQAVAMVTDLEQGADFLAMVAERSVDPYRVREGLVDDIARIDLQRSVADLVFSIEPGQIAGPVQTDLGWSVVRLENRRTADPERFTEIEPLVRSVVQQQKARERRTALAETLRAHFEVKINRDVVESIQPQRLADARLLPTEVDSGAIAVRIGDNLVITGEEYSRALLSRWKGVRSEDAARAAAPIVLDRLIEAKLVEAEALARGLDRSPETEQSVAAFENELLLERYLDEVLTPQVTVSPAEMKAYYDKNREGYHRPPRVRLGQITVGSEEEALNVADLLGQGTDLGWLAKQRSTDRFAQEGGDRGWYVPQPGLPDFNEELFDAPIGAVLAPFGDSENWIVLKVLDRQEQGIYSYEEVSGNVRQSVFNQKVLTSIDRLIKALRSRSEIEIREEALAVLRISGDQETGKADDPMGGHGH